MRVRIVAAAVLFLVLGVVAGRQIDTSPAIAQSTESRPLLFNEVENWCQYRCDATYIDLDNGYLRVVLSEFQGKLDGACYSVEIPDGVEGWAYANTEHGVEGGSVTTIADVRSRPDLAVCEMVVRHTVALD